MFRKYDSEVKMSKSLSLPRVYDTAEFQGDAKQGREKLKVLGNVKGIASSHWPDVL